MRLAALISGGKDSLYSIYLSQNNGHEITHLLSMIPQRSDSYMFHHPNIRMTKVQAELMGVPLLMGKTRGEKEKELEDLEHLISRVKHKVDGILTGALASNYQKSRIDRICEKFNLKSVSPLWHADMEKYWGDVLNAGFKVMIIAVSAYGLGEEWLGRIIDERAVEELKELNKKFKIHLGFEGGEAETLVLSCPMFKKEIKIVDGEKIWDGCSGVYLIKKWTLE